MNEPEVIAHKLHNANRGDREFALVTHQNITGLSTEGLWCMDCPSIINTWFKFLHKLFL